MPDKISTEIQIARLLGATQLQVELMFVNISNYTPSEHVASLYHDWPNIKALKFDAFIITGAPIEAIPFEEVRSGRTASIADDANNEPPASAAAAAINLRPEIDLPCPLAVSATATQVWLK